MLMFIGALTVVYLVPGPDMILVLQAGASGQKGRAVATIAGLASARTLHILAATLGLATLLEASPLAFDLVRVVGAAYIAYVGIQLLRAPSLLPAVEADRPATGTGQSASRAVAWAGFRRGMLTNLLNPKALLFCSMLLPQFVDPQAGPYWLQLVALGAVTVGIGLVFDSLVALAGRQIAGRLAASPRVQAVQKWLFGSLLIGFGARLALD